MLVKEKLHVPGRLVNDDIYDKSNNWKEPGR
jgi:hypothetical protein